MDLTALAGRLNADPVLVIGSLSLLAAAFAGGMIALVVLAVLRARRRRAEAAAAAQAAEEAAAARLAELQRLQAETAGQVRAMGQMLHAQHAELQRAVHARLDSVTERLGQSMQSTTKQTTDNLQKLNERLAVIDSAQKNITDLASQVTSLTSVLANKQQRGAFGQGRMEVIIQDGLPKTCYAFQYTLSNRSRPDARSSCPTSARSSSTPSFRSRRSPPIARRQTTSSVRPPRGCCASMSAPMSPTLPRNTSSPARRRSWP